MSTTDDDGSTQDAPAVGIVRQVRGSNRRRMLGDVAAGVTVAALVLPLSMGLAVTAGLPPEAGLYASMLPMAVFALVATSRQTMIGPDASVTALVVASVLPMSDGRPDRHVELVAALAIAAGACCMLAAAIGVGRIASLLRASALTGYLAGLAVVVGVAQLPRIVGIPAPDQDSTMLLLVEVVRHAREWSVPSVVIGTLTFLLVVGARARRPALPWMLVAVAAAAVVARVTGWADAEVATVGAIPSGLPSLHVPDVSWSDMSQLLPVALGIVLVTFADTVATSSAFAHRNGYRTSPGRDLAALGIADLAAGLSGGRPVSASGARTAAAESSGGTTQLTGLVAAATIGIVLLGAGGAIATLPQPALGAVVVAAVLPMVDVQSLGRLRALDREEFVVAIVVAVSVVLVGVLEGILVAFVASIVERLRRR